MTQLAKGVVKKLFTQGVLPLYKDKGVSKQDLANWIKLTLYFENPSIKRGTLFIELLPRYPELYQTGVCAAGFGIHAKQIATFNRYWKHEYMVTAILGRQTADYYNGSPLLEQHEYGHITADEIQNAFGKYIGEKEQSNPPTLIQEQTIPAGENVLISRLGDGLEGNNEDVIEKIPPPINNNSPNGDSAAGKRPLYRIKHCHSIELLQKDDATIRMRVISDGLFNCRAFVRDLGHDLGCFATIEQLHLYSVGPLTDKMALLKHELHLKQIVEALTQHTDSCQKYMAEMRLQYPSAGPNYRFI